MNLSRLLPVYFVVFVGFLGYSMMIAVFTPMFLHGSGHLVSPDASHSAKTILLGVVLCMYPLGQFISSSIIGSLSDKYGRRPVLIFSLVFSLLCYVVMARAIEVESLWLLIIALVAAGLSEGNIVIGQSAISDVSDATHRGRFFGYIYMSASLAYVVGPLVGGKLASPSVVSWFSYATPFWAMLVPMVITLGAVCVFFKETRVPSASVHVHWLDSLANLSHVFLPGHTRILYFANFAFYLGIFGFFRCYPMYFVDQFNMGVSRVSEFIAWFSVPIIIGSVWLAGALTARYPIAKVTIWSAIFTALSMILIVIPSSPNALWVTLVIVGLPLSVCMTSCATMLSVSVPAEKQGSVLGNNQALQVFAESVSGLIGGFIAALMVKASLAAMAGFVLIGAVALLVRHRVKDGD
ncbi:MAG: MFS transporter [Chthoniobacterales bacterium]